MIQSKAEEAAVPSESALVDRVIHVFAILAPAGLAVAFLSFLPTVSAGTDIRWSIPWLPSLGIRFAFLVDGLSLIFAVLISGIGCVISLYSGTYLRGHPHLSRFFLYLLLFMASMLGLVLADDLITLFVFWELTTVSSYLLIGFEHKSDKARRSALQALVLTGAGGLALLAGLILMGVAAGTYELSAILSGTPLREHTLYVPILILVLIGAFTKSAQVPFHFWLPNAMAAPTPVSAYLHSATMVKAGIYLLARFHPTLSGTPEWLWTLTIFGAATAVWGSILAVRQTDLKLALAYTTVMALGTLTMFLGSEASIAVAAAITFLIVHSLYKAALFLIVGILDHETGTRDARRLRGLAKSMPITAAIAATAAFSMAGFPPFLGFIGKELKYEGALAIAAEPWFVVPAIVLANALMVALAAVIALRPFHGGTPDTPKSPHEAPLTMWIGPAVFALLGLAFGMAPGLVSDPLVQPAVQAILGRPEEVYLALWHGINVPLMLSIFTVLLGILIYRQRQWLQALLDRLGDRLVLSGDRSFDGFMDGLKALAAWQTRVLQSGQMTRYLRIVFTTTAIAILGTIIVKEAWPTLAIPAGTLVREWAVIALIIAGTIMTLFMVSRLAMICALGAVGVGVSLVFLLFGAPDLAITQLLVETLVVVLVAVVMLRLPRFGEASALMAGRRMVNAVIAGAVGLATTLVLIGVSTGPIDRRLTTFFEEASVPDAYGRNIVNVILVDFRALDTFGEVAVVAVAGLAALAVLRLRKPAERTTDRSETPS